MAADNERSLLRVDRYVYWHETKAPPRDWADIMPGMMALHDAGAGYVVVGLGLAPVKERDGVGFTWVSGFIEHRWVEYVKYALDATLQCSSFVDHQTSTSNASNGSSGSNASNASNGSSGSNASNGSGATDSASVVGSERLVMIKDGIRHFQHWPNQQARKESENFLKDVNGKLLQLLNSSCSVLTVIDHVAGRREWIFKTLAKILRNRHKVANPTSKSGGKNFYLPAIQGLRKERDESQRALYIQGIREYNPSFSLKSLLEMTLNELQVKYLTVKR